MILTKEKSKLIKRLVSFRLQEQKDSLNFEQSVRKETVYILNKCYELGMTDEQIQRCMLREIMVKLAHLLLDIKKIPRVRTLQQRFAEDVSYFLDKCRELGATDEEINKLVTSCLIQACK